MERLTWIEEFRRKHDLTRLELSKICGVSPALICILEERPRAVTHPKLANRLAAVCGATPAQRDGIVDAKHRGTYTPPEHSKLQAKLKQYMDRRSALRAEEARSAETEGEWHHPHGSPATRAVVAVNMCGRVVARYRTATLAAEAEGLSNTTVKWRCNRKLTGGEFAGGRMVTFRWADEWENMTEAQRADDVKAGDPNAQRLRPGGVFCRPVVQLDRNGAELGRWNSILEARAATGWANSKIHRRVRRLVDKEFRHADTTFRYVDEWEAMTPAQRQADIKGP